MKTIWIGLLVIVLIIASIYILFGDTSSDRVISTIDGIIKDSRNRDVKVTIGYLGAFKDSADDRALPISIGDASSFTDAMSKAYQMRAKYVGLQYYRPDEKLGQVWIGGSNAKYAKYGPAIAEYNVGPGKWGTGYVNAVYKFM